MQAYSSMEMAENPVLWKELKVRMRSRQSVPVRAVVVGVIGLIVVVAYYYVFSSMSHEANTSAIKEWWTASVAIQATIIWLMCPALAANAITQEKEQQTWEMLVFTLLSPVEILIGKLLSRLVPIIAILAAFVPFTVYCFARGGPSSSDLLVSYGIFGVWIGFLVTCSLFMSWAFRRTSAAVAMSYLLLFALTIGTAIGEQVIGAAFGHGDPDTPVLWLNPVRILSAMFEPAGTHSTEVLMLSTAAFIVGTVMLFWYMAARFRLAAAE